MEVVLDQVQKETLIAAAAGFTAKQISELLGIDEKRVDLIVRDLMKALGLQSRLELTLFVYSHWSSGANRHAA